MLGVAVACVAAATLFAELTLTRIFSVLFYYHFSFFAVALAMSGLAIGGLWIARWQVRSLESAEFARRLANLALAGAVVGTLELLLFALRPPAEASGAAVAGSALQWLPLFVVSGAFLSAAFARKPEWIGELYGWDLVAAGAACLATIPLLRGVPGPAALFVVPALFGACAATIEPAGRFRRGAGVTLALGSCVALLAGHWSTRPLIGLDDTPPGVAVVFERWNEYSRIQGRLWPTRPRQVEFVIDRSAATQMPLVPAGPGGQPPTVNAASDSGLQALPYQLNRPRTRVAIIGIGGGGDFLAPLARGAREVVGFEYNQIFIDLLKRDYVHWNAVATRPEVQLVHGEGRTAIAHDSRRFDVIQASLTDTWAATAAGGFVLAENGLYTIEGWTTLLAALVPGGVLTMTRWYLTAAPIETHRLVALAAAALERAGVPDPRRHVLLVSGNPDPPLYDPVFGAVGHVTIIVSQAAFEPREVARMRDAAARRGYTVLAAPGVPGPDPTVIDLLDPSRREPAIAAHPYDISPPTDTRPYFFLQLRPRDVARMVATDAPSGLSEVSLHAVRAYVALVIAAFAVTGLVLVLARGLPTASDRPAPLALRGYFAAIGVGYMLVQLGLHQRLIVVLGHPTYALAVVLFSMLIGTGLGALASQRLAGRVELGWLVIVAVVAGAVVGFGEIPAVERIDTEPLRLLAAGSLVLAIGMALGLAFPLGVALAAPGGERIIQRMWAVNGAASIAGAALAALIGLAVGSRATVLGGLLCYMAAGLMGTYVRRRVAIFQS
jgi:hypothetical protein